MALLACEVCGASIEVSSRNAEVACSACGSEYDVIVHASPLTYSVYLSAEPSSGSAPLVVLVSGGVAVDGHPYVTTVYIYRNGVLIKTVRSDGLYGTFEAYDVLTEAGTYKYQAKAVGAESPVRTVTVTAPPPVKKATSLTMVGSPLQGFAPVTVTLWATLSDEAGGGVGGRKVSFYMNDEFQFSRITDEGGRITTSVKITAEGTYKIVTEFAGDEMYEPSRSNVATVKVSAAPPPPPPGEALAKITAHTTPAEATEGGTITISGTIQNQGDASGNCLIIINDEFGDMIVPDSYAFLEAGASMTRSGSTVMPNKDYSTYVWAYHWDGEDWVLDDKSTRTITLAVAPTYKVTVKNWVTKKPIADAEVVVIDIGGAFTDDQGVADLTDVIPAAGTYEVGVRKTDYKSVKRTMEFPGVNQVELVPLWAIGLGVAGAAAVCTVVVAKAVKK